MALSRRGGWILAVGAVCFIVAFAIMIVSRRWPYGTWISTTPGVAGQLIVESDAETATFRLSLDRNAGALAWEGTARWTSEKLSLRVFHEDGRLLYPDHDFTCHLTLKDGLLTGQISGTPVTFAKQ